MLVSQGSVSGEFNCEFPPLRFHGVVNRPDHLQGDVKPSLNTCGELWVLLLLLLPEHLRASVSQLLVGLNVTHGISKTVRGPWALPLEVLRGALEHALPPPDSQRCSHSAV